VGGRGGGGGGGYSVAGGGKGGPGKNEGIVGGKGLVTGAQEDCTASPFLQIGTVRWVVVEKGEQRGMGAS